LRLTSASRADGKDVWSCRLALFGLGKPEKPLRVKGFYELSACAAPLAKTSRALIGLGLELINFSAVTIRY
jgi:hypothetical protein